MKKYIKILMVLLMVFVLSGCMKMNTTIDVNSDASMVMSVDFLMSESFLKSTYGSSETAIAKLQEQFKSQNTDFKEAKFKVINKNIDGENWAGFSASTKLAKDDTNSMVKEEKIDGVDSVVLTLSTNTASQGMGTLTYGDSMSELKQKGLEVNVTINMPAKATSNYGEVDGKQVKINLLELQSKGVKQNIVVSSAKSEFPLGLILGIVGAVVIVLVIFIVLKKKKPTGQVMTGEADNTVEPIAQESHEVNNEPMGEMPIVENTTIGDDIVEETQTTDIKEDSDIQMDTPVEENQPIEVIENQEIQTVAPDVEDKKSFCSNCGKPIGDTDFCPNCGHHLKKS